MLEKSPIEIIQGPDIIPAAPHELRHVDMDQYRVDKGILVTSGVSTCIVLAAVNTESGFGTLAHVSDLTNGAHSKNQREIFDKALGSVVSLGDREHTKLWMSGGSHLTTNGELLSSSKRNRKYAENRLSQFRLASQGNTRVEWLEDDLSMDISLNTVMGRLAIEKSVAFRIPDSTDPLVRLAKLLEK